MSEQTADDYAGFECDGLEVYKLTNGNLEIIYEDQSIAIDLLQAAALRDWFIKVLP